MRVLLCVFDVSMLKECGVTAILVWETGDVWLRWVRILSRWVVHVECWWSGVCGMCMCLAQAWWEVSFDE